MARQVADVVRELRASGIKLSEIADRIGVSWGTARKWERGIQGVSPENAAKWREEFGEEVVASERPGAAAPAPALEADLAALRRDVAWLATFARGLVDSSLPVRTFNGKTIEEAPEDAAQLLRDELRQIATDLRAALGGAASTAEELSLIRQELARLRGDRGS